MSDSLAFNNETLLYNNQYEMYFNVPQYEMLYSGTTAYSNSAGYNLLSNADFADYPYGVISFEQVKSVSFPNYNLVNITFDTDSWMLMNSGGGNVWLNNYPSVRAKRFGLGQGTNHWLENTNENVYTSSAEVGSSFKWLWANHYDNTHYRFKLVVDVNNSAVSAFYGNTGTSTGQATVFVGQGLVSGSRTGIKSITLKNSSDNSDTFSIRNFRVFGASTYNIATGVCP